jgi:hypothetical protein
VQRHEDDRGDDNGGCCGITPPNFLKQIGADEKFLIEHVDEDIEQRHGERRAGKFRIIRIEVRHA